MSSGTRTIDLRGPDGNAFTVLARARLAMQASGKSKAEIDAVLDDAMSGDYQRLLDVCARDAGLTYVGRPSRYGRTSWPGRVGGEGR